MLTNIFCEVDDFCKLFEKEFKNNVLTSGKKIRKREFKLSLSEIITIIIFYHHSGYKTFKDYYAKHVLVYMKTDFNNLVSYNRFLELRKSATVVMLAFIELNSRNKCTGKSFIDSFALHVSHIKRIYSHKVFKGLATRGKTSVDWFYGFKLHLVTNTLGEIISFYITPGNVADNNETVILKLTKKLFGKVFGDKGYLLNKKLSQKLYSKGVSFITKLRKNMPNKLMLLDDKNTLRKRGLIESIGAILKQSMSLDHSRHRSHYGFLSNILSTLCAYIFKPNKPSLLKNFLSA
jgi:IS5 family transposase